MNTAQSAVKPNWLVGTVQGLANIYKPFYEGSIEKKRLTVQAAEQQKAKELAAASAQRSISNNATLQKGIQWLGITILGSAVSYFVVREMKG